MNQKANIAAIILLASLTACVDNPKNLPKEEDGVKGKQSQASVTFPRTGESGALTDRSKVKDMGKTKFLAAEGLAETRSQTAAKSPVAPMAAHDTLYKVPMSWNRESYSAMAENGFINSLNDPLSTFSIDVDTASYSNIRRFIYQGSLPPVGAVRIEEMINYFSYEYPQPADSRPITLSAEIGPSPYNQDFDLVRIGIKARDMEPDKLPPSNLVFLVDVSGSMNHPKKLGLLKQSLSMLVAQLGKKDRVSIVAYAGTDRIILEPTKGNRKDVILAALNDLRSGGSTHASRGIHTAYKLADQVFIPGGNNRVILATDGDFNVGVTSRGELNRLITAKRDSGIYLTVLGFGMGNYHDDTMEVLADSGNGNYAYIDSLLEAKKVLVKEISGTLYTLANDVKLQVEFNPALVGAYRLVGYENRTLADEDFRNDKRDAGEIGAGHTVTALYELIPVGHKAIPRMDKLKYQQAKPASPRAERELLTVKLRYKDQNNTASKEIRQSIIRNDKPLNEMSDDFRFAAAVAGYGMLLRDSELIGDYSWDKCIGLIQGARGSDPEGYRGEFLRLVEMSRLIKEKS